MRDKVMTNVISGVTFIAEGGIPKGGAGYHVERIYMLRGSLVTFSREFS